MGALMFSVHLQKIIDAVHSAQDTLETHVELDVLKPLPCARSSLDTGSSPLKLINTVFPWELQDLPLSSHVLFKLTQNKNQTLEHLQNFQDDVRRIPLFAKDTVMFGLSGIKGERLDYIRLERHISCPSNVHSENLSRMPFAHQAKVLDRKLTQASTAFKEWETQPMKAWTARTLTANGHRFTQTRAVLAPTAEDALKVDAWAHWSQEPHYHIQRDIVDAHGSICARTPVYDDIQY